MMMLHDRLQDNERCKNRNNCKCEKGVKHNTHHIIWPRKSYDTGWAKRLREFPWLRVELPESVHNSIHRDVERVPLPAVKRMKEAVLILEDLAAKGSLDRDASIITRIEVLLCIWDGYTDTAHTCNALRAQKRIVQRYYELRLP